VGRPFPGSTSTGEHPKASVIMDISGQIGVSSGPWEWKTVEKLIALPTT